MGGLFGGSKTSTTTSTPWGPQGDALKSIFNTAGNLYSSKAGTPWYEGDLYANMDPATADAIRGMLSYVQGQGASDASAVSGAGSPLLGAGQNLYDTAGQLAAASGQDPTQANIAAATAYANNPAIDGMIDAASRDVKRNLYEQQVPGVRRASTGTGNINSSRSGAMEAIAHRGASDRIADISAGIRGDAFNRGLSLAEQARTTNLGALDRAAGLYGQTFGQGLEALNLGRNFSLGNFGSAIDASSLFQQDAQGQLDADFKKWLGNDTREFDLLNQYYNIIGANNWGGTQTTKEKNRGSIFGSILGGLSTAAGLGAFGGGGK